MVIIDNRPRYSTTFLKSGQQNQILVCCRTPTAKA